MLDRFNFAPVFIGHWKGLTKDTDTGPVPDWGARGVVAGVPLLVIGLMAWKDVELSFPGVLLTAVSLLSGASLTVFAQLSSLRLKLTEWFDDDDTSRDSDKDALDESVSHLMAATIACVFAAVIIVVGMVTSKPDAVSLSGVAAYAAGGISAYIALLYVMLIPRLYYAYVNVNRVRGNLNGFEIDNTSRRMRRVRRHW
ncbi:hypothetical protein [Rhodococcus sp. LB1]|uniref:hypothetical protein n=1 Tax=Rhodococcus sp. LB1 TaxID=1807499 RepID=UPI00077A20A1|nr:hypothetical protein [Rhodococcus sp. LB1]KXX59433.1 hypothetical protein AZG88_41325 [Rhodococcus sp. LB1]